MSVCPTPQKYGDFSRADAKARRRRMSAKQSVAGLRPYLCECGFWHLGHSALRIDRLPIVECSKRLHRSRRDTCPRPGTHRLDAGGATAWLCDEHWDEFSAALRRIQVERRAAALA